MSRAGEKFACPGRTAHPAESVNRRSGPGAGGEFPTRRHDSGVQVAHPADDLVRAASGPAAERFGRLAIGALPRRTPQAAHKRMDRLRSTCSPPNEGRSLHSGDTIAIIAVALAIYFAQRRPESELRRHSPCAASKAEEESVSHGPRDPAQVTDIVSRYSSAFWNRDCPDRAFFHGLYPSKIGVNPLADWASPFLQGFALVIDNFIPRLVIVSARSPRSLPPYSSPRGVAARRGLRRGVGRS